MSKLTHIILYTILAICLGSQQVLIMGYIKINNNLSVTIDGLIEACPGSKGPPAPETPDLKDRYR